MGFHAFVEHLAHVVAVAAGGFHEHAGVRAARQHGAPQPHGLGTQLGDGVAGAERDVAVVQRRGRLHAEARVVDLQRVGDDRVVGAEHGRPEQLLRVVVVEALRIGGPVGHAVLDLLHAGGAGVAQPRQLLRGQAMHHVGQGRGARVAAQVDHDVAALRAHGLDHLGLGHLVEVVEALRVDADLLGDVVVDVRQREQVHLEAGAVQIGDQRNQEVGAGMAAQVVRQDADADPLAFAGAQRRGFHGRARQRAGPVGGLAAQFLGADGFVVEQREQQVGAVHALQRVQRAGAAEHGNGFDGAARFAQRGGVVAHRHRVVRQQAGGFLAGQAGFEIVAGIEHGRAEHLPQMGRAGLEFQAALEQRNAGGVVFQGHLERADQAQEARMVREAFHAGFRQPLGFLAMVQAGQAQRFEVVRFGERAGNALGSAGELQRVRVLVGVVGIPGLLDGPLRGTHRNVLGHGVVLCKGAVPARTADGLIDACTVTRDVPRHRPEHGPKLALFQRGCRSRRLWDGAGRVR
ncbi:hypothetical protein D3C87_1032930 [compost metagenome]